MIFISFLIAFNDLVSHKVITLYVLLAIIPACTMYRCYGFCHSFE